jgi:peptidyl-prolyl cis-trans isomerase SDCCAG10
VFTYFQDEFHSRLRFVRRGLVAMANAGANDNGSQFTSKPKQ